MIEKSALPFALPAVSRKRVVVACDGGRLSSDGGVALLSQVERRLGIADRLAACLRDRRDPDRTRHTVKERLLRRWFAIAAGSEDATDCDALRHDPAFKRVVGRALCSQPTLSRLENAPSRTTVARLRAARVDLFCASFAQPPQAIPLDLDGPSWATPEAVHLRRGAGPAATLAVQQPRRQPRLPADPRL